MKLSKSQIRKIIMEEYDAYSIDSVRERGQASEMADEVHDIMNAMGPNSLSGKEAYDMVWDAVGWCDDGDPSDFWYNMLSTDGPIGDAIEGLRDTGDENYDPDMPHPLDSDGDGNVDWNEISESNSHNMLSEDQGFIDVISDYLSQAGDSASNAMSNVARAAGRGANSVADSLGDNDISSNSRRLDDLFGEFGATRSDIKSNIADSLGSTVNEEEAGFLHNLLSQGLDMLPDSVRSSIVDVGTDILLGQASEEELEKMIISYAQGLSSEDLIRIASSHMSDIGTEEIQDMLRSFVVSMDKDQLINLIQASIDSGFISDDQILDIGLDYVV